MTTPAGRGLRTSNILVRSYTSSKQLETGGREQAMNDGDELTESVQICWPADASGCQHQDGTDIPQMLFTSV